MWNIFCSDIAILYFQSDIKKNVSKSHYFPLLSEIQGKNMKIEWRVEEINKWSKSSFFLSIHMHPRKRSLGSTWNSSILVTCNGTGSVSYEAAYYQSQLILHWKKILLDSFKIAIYLQSLLYDLAMNLDLNQSYKF